MRKIPVGILGATGLVGQTYAKLLENHPLFEIAFLSASPRTNSLSFQDALLKKRYSLNEKTLGLTLSPLENINEAASTCRIIFSALGNDLALEFENQYAAAGLAVFSSASAFRFDLDIPLIIPEINPDHLDLIPIQQKKRGWKKGCLVSKPNCTLQSFLLPLFPLHQKFRLRKILVNTFQSTSGGGSNLTLEGNIIPFIEGEEEKSEREPLKILGSLIHDSICPLQDLTISAHCHRVPVPEGHLASVSVAFEKKPQKEEMIKIWESFKGLPQNLKLPSAPLNPIYYSEALDRPQPALDLDVEGGMSVVVGRLRSCALLDMRFSALSHNLIRGAAGGGILTAELALKMGVIDG